MDAAASPSRKCQKVLDFIESRTEGYCFARQEHVADQLGISVRTLGRRLAELVRGGWIAAEYQGPRAAHYYPLKKVGQGRPRSANSAGHLAEHLAELQHVVNHVNSSSAAAVEELKKHLPSVADHYARTKPPDLITAALAFYRWRTCHGSPITPAMLRDALDKPAKYEIEQGPDGWRWRSPSGTAAQLSPEERRRREEEDRARLLRETGRDRLPASDEEEDLAMEMLRKAAGTTRAKA